MREAAIIGLAIIAVGCGSSPDSDAPSSNVENGKPCPNLARSDEMWINVMREDSKQMNNLVATIHFGDTAQEWKCESTLQKIHCQATSNMVSIVAMLDDFGEVTAIELDDLKGATYSGNVVFEWSELPVSYRCSNTYRRGVFDVILAN